MSGQPARTDLSHSSNRGVDSGTGRGSATGGQLMVGIDVGGTFTDVVAVNGAGQRVTAFKIPSTRANPAEAVTAGLRQILTDPTIAPVGPDTRISLVGHGTTVGTNALLERRGAACALLITKGFRALYELRGGSIPSGSDLVDTFYQKVPVLVPQRATYEIPGRLDATGAELTALDEEAVRAAARQLRAAEVASIAVCYLFSYVNPRHEQHTRELILEEHPDCSVSLSSDVLPVVREYRRMSTTVLDAYVGPIVGGYLRHLLDRAGQLGVAPERVFIMQSNGGLTRAGIAVAHPNELLLSGPAAGVVFGSRLADQAGEVSAVTFDMGGTSTDISVVGGSAGNRGFIEAVGSEIAGQDIGTALVRIRTIGAGGGTIARIGADGMLKVGPESAGAEPGPACYGLGGAHSTVTDANLVLGYLPVSIAGGARSLDVARARAAIEEHVARPLGLSITEAALGISRVVNSNMEIALRMSLMEWGLDPRGCALIAMGGAGAVHAAKVAEGVGLSRVIVPEAPGLACAVGLLQSDIAHNYVLSRPGPLSFERVDEIEGSFKELEARAIAESDREGFPASAVALNRQLYLRYRHQGYDLPIVWNNPLTVSTVAHLVDAFHQEHLRVYGMNAVGERVDLVTLRVTSVVSGARVGADGTDSDTGTGGTPTAGRPAPTPVGYREMAFPDVPDGNVAPVYQRTDLVAGVEVAGPAGIDQVDTTIVVPPGWRATARASDALELNRDGGDNATGAGG